MSINYQEFLDYLDDIHERVADGRLIIYDPINYVKNELMRNHEAWLKQKSSLPCGRCQSLDATNGDNLCATCREWCVEMLKNTAKEIL